MTVHEGYRKLTRNRPVLALAAVGCAAALLFAARVRHNRIDRPDLD